MSQNERWWEKKKDGRCIFFLYPLYKQQVGQAQARWTEGIAVPRSKVYATIIRSKTVTPIVAFRVGAAGYPAAPPTDPDVNNSLIRFLGSTPSYRSRNQPGDTPVGA